ncbi:MAG: GNAT family N-acetyltransferase [Anaerolineae bacterium]
MTLHIRLLEAQDIHPIADAFLAIGWHKPVAQYERYLTQQQTGQRVVLVAFVEDIFAGYVTIVWQSSYPPFREADIPEIQDFNVLPRFQRRGIGSRLMDEAEQRVARQSPLVGIGVGMYADYGTAQRMYVRRGYIPDGRGLFFRGHFVKPGDKVIVDDDLSLQFTKKLR